MNKAVNAYRIFPLRRGEVRLHPHHLEVYQVDGTARLLQRLRLDRVSVLYYLLVGGLLLGVVVALVILNYALVAFFLVAAGWAFWRARQHRRQTLATRIPYEDIEHVAYHPAVEGEARGQFVVHYGNGLRRRLVLPSKRQGGGQVAQSAFYLLRDHGLEVRAK